MKWSASDVVTLIEKLAQYAVVAVRKFEEPSRVFEHIVSRTQDLREREAEIDDEIYSHFHSGTSDGSHGTP